jgi:hypothetical protein
MDMVQGAHDLLINLPIKSSPSGPCLLCRRFEKKSLPSTPWNFFYTHPYQNVSVLPRIPRLESLSIEDNFKAWDLKQGFELLREQKIGILDDW